MNKKYLVVGHSHSECIIHSFWNKKIPVEWGHVPYSGGNYPVLQTDNGLQLLPDIGSTLKDKDENASFVISTIAGNAHNIVGLIESIPTFDFDLPGNTKNQCSNRQLLPFNLVYDSMYETMNGDLQVLEACNNLFKIIDCHVESPPPLKDEKLVKSLLDSFFIDNFPDAKIADPYIRLKLHNVHSMIFREKCVSLGIKWLPYPPDAVDNEGFLKPEFSAANSCTHGNDNYGDLVVNQILKILL